MTAIAYDPFSAAARENPYPHYAELRRHAPVQRVEGSGQYLVARYGDVQHVLRHPELFSSDAMQQMVLAGFGLGAGAPGMGFSGGDAARLVELMHEPPISLPEIIRSRSLIASDPPVHGPMRSLVNRGFTPRSSRASGPSRARRSTPSRARASSISSTISRSRCR